ncbi:hypothetical protein ACFQ58_01130 [Agromyces sp. NPDC056523]|uniref:hypothetical protein n=1 Tax=Agromyces sp. NPDC056523 TaxID=3345850 RepID=UPI00366E02BF
MSELDDERITRLQRAAFGADSPATVRAQALAELAELATGRTAGGPARGAAAPDEDSARDRLTGEPPVDSTGAEPHGEGEPKSRGRRWIAIAGVAGLLVGAVAGAALGRAVPAEPGLASSDTAPTAPAFGSGEPGIPLDETDLPELFDRLPPVADVSQLDQVTSSIDVSSLRLIAARADGPAGYLARTPDGNDVCLILLVAPDGWAEARCTTSGRLPAGGLRIQVAHPIAGFAVAILTRGGTLTLGLNAGR